MTKNSEELRDFLRGLSPEERRQLISELKQNFEEGGVDPSTEFVFRVAVGLFVFTLIGGVIYVRSAKRAAQNAAMDAERSASLALMVLRALGGADSIKAL